MWLLLCDLRVEVGHAVVGIVPLWDELSGNLSAQEGIKVHSLEELVAKHIIYVVLLAESLLSILLTKLGNEVFCLVTDADLVSHRVWPSQRGLLDQHIHLVLVFMIKWRDSNYHFVDQHAQGPPVESVIVSRANYHLW